MAKYLSDFTAPAINGFTAGLVLANEILEGIAQGEIEAPGRGITEKFTNDTTGAQIRVIRMLPLTQKARELGNSINGGNFAGVVEQPQSVEVGIDVITVIDTPIDIANVTQDMISVDVLSKTKDNLTQLVNRNLNGMTVAVKLTKSLPALDKNITYVGANDNLADKALLASALLDEGDEDNNIDIFPQEGRVFVLKGSYRAELFKQGILSLGGSNYAQEMLASGAASPNAKTNKVTNGYIGDFDGTPVHTASQMVWSIAEQYAGLPRGEFDSIIGYFSSDYANARGVAMNERVKVIDSPNGQGIRLQPLVRMGAASWYAKGNSLLVKGASTDKNYNDVAVAVDSAYASKVVAPGSRMDATIKYASGTLTVTPSAGSTVKKTYYKTGATAISGKVTLASFYAYGTAGIGSTFTSGTALTSPAAHVYALVEMTDGTFITFGV